MKFIDKRTKEIKTAYAVEKNGEKIYVRFTEHGKTYAYRAENIEMLEEAKSFSNRIYRLIQPCYKCRRHTAIFTYIVFADNPKEDLVFPWDKKRLVKSQDIFAHMQDPTIEYYGLKVIGGDEQLDKMLLEKFPGRIEMQYSKTQGRSYPMNLCEHCGAKQGEYFIYRRVNEMIKNMQEIDCIFI